MKVELVCRNHFFTLVRNRNRFGGINEIKKKCCADWCHWPLVPYDGWDTQIGDKPYHVLDALHSGCTTPSRSIGMMKRGLKVDNSTSINASPNYIHNKWTISLSAITQRLLVASLQHAIIIVILESYVVKRMNCINFDRWLVDTHQHKWKKQLQLIHM